MAGPDAGEVKPEPGRSTAHPAWSIFDRFEPPRQQPVRRRASWAVFDGFEHPRPAVSWTLLDDFVIQGRRFAEERCRAFPELQRRWNTLLHDLDGDPSRVDWSHFRPLRFGREEDWSDWLQHFLATSESGAFAYQLLSMNRFPDAVCCVHPQVRREVVVGDRRADLVIDWADGSHTHVEVKVGDRAFAKTVETASNLEQKYPGTWTHYLLLPAEDLKLWRAIDSTETPVIHAITWDDVVVALRRSLRCTTEARQWRWWAHGFCGIVEHRMVGLPGVGEMGGSLRDLSRRLRQISIMKRGLDDAGQG